MDGNWSWSLQCLPHIWSWHAFLALDLAGNVWIHLANETECGYLTLGYNYTDKVMDVWQGGKSAMKAINWPDLKPCIYKKRWQGARWTPWNRLHILSLQQSGWPNQDKLRFVPFTPMSFIKPLHNRINLTNGEVWVWQFGPLSNVYSRSKLSWMKSVNALCLKKALEFFSKNHHK